MSISDFGTVVKTSVMTLLNLGYRRNKNKWIFTGGGSKQSLFHSLAMGICHDEKMVISGQHTREKPMDKPSGEKIITEAGCNQITQNITSV